MPIPYPKREFLNDDDGDAKSSAAKVMSLINGKYRNINTGGSGARTGNW